MEKVDLELNKTYIVKENDEIFTMKLFEYSKNELFVRVDEAGSVKPKWRYVSDFDSSIEILDEEEEKVTQPIEQPIAQPIVQLPQNTSTNVASPQQFVTPPLNQSPITPTLLPYASNYNLNKIQDLISNMEVIINKYKQGK
jgi:hypothetical protein